MEEENGKRKNENIYEADGKTEKKWAKLESDVLVMTISRSQAKAMGFNPEKQTRSEVRDAIKAKAGIPASEREQGEPFWKEQGFESLAEFKDTIRKMLAKRKQ